MSVISHPNQVTPAWLTSILKGNGWRGAITSVRWQPIGAGQMGDNARFTLTGTDDIPATLVGKFPSEDPTSRYTAQTLGNYEREVFFFTDLANTVEVSAPKLIAAEFDPETHDFYILMEDLAPGRQIDQMSACSNDQAALALEQLAKLHGPRWGDPALLDYRQLNWAQSLDGVPAFTLFQGGFLERYRERLNDAEVAAIEKYGAAQAAGLQPVCTHTLIHIDYRLDNMIFGGPRPLTVLDWQSLTHGCAFQDVSYFMGTSLTSDQRAREERNLLAHYLENLSRYDVSLGFDDAWRLYRHHAGAGLNMAVVASMIVGETARGNDMFMAMAKRSIAMAEDLDTWELLGETR